MVQCKRCGESKDTRDYYKRNGYLRQPCKRCFIKASVKWNKEHSVRKRLKWQLAEYNMTVEQYDQMLEAQGGVCAICKKPCASKSRLSVDHDHETNEVRGLLCANCNHGLGHFKDSIDLLLVAIEYLRRPESFVGDEAPPEGRQAAS